ncbi:MAG: ATP-binding protein [Chlamydiales bacterium]|nr:ATP-binding protein [Chlamydiales bacterium]
MQYIPRKLTIPKDSFFLFGPRGTGKSTWLKHAFPDALRIDLLNREMERTLLAKPERLIEMVAPLKKGDVCILDEIQRVPELIPVIHSLIEEQRGIQFILTGSSARKLRRNVGDLLGGRALLRHMPPFLAAELEDRFSLGKALLHGLVPMIWQSESPEEKVRTYVSSYLKEEVQMEGLVRQIGDFARFMEVASFSHGSLWVSSEIAREASVKRQTVDNYLQILEDLLLAFTIPVFTRRAKRALVSRSKFYYFDPGIFRELRPHGPLDKEAELEGPALEGLVAGHLRAWTFAQQKTHQLYFWRTRSKVEVDFVVYGPKGFWAIEVKRGQNLGPNDVKPLTIFQKEYPEATPLLLYTGKIKQKINGILCVPVEEFLLNLEGEKGLDPSP